MTSYTIRLVLLQLLRHCNDASDHMTLPRLCLYCLRVGGGVPSGGGDALAAACCLPGSLLVNARGRQEAHSSPAYPDNRPAPHLLPQHTQLHLATVRCGGARCAPLPAPMPVLIPRPDRISPYWFLSGVLLLLPVAMSIESTLGRMDVRCVLDRGKQSGVTWR